MDLSKIDLTAAADKGITTELANPVTGEPLEDEGGKRITIKVLGRDSQKNGNNICEKWSKGMQPNIAINQCLAR
jgi:hypothetical protein